MKSIKDEDKQHAIDVLRELERKWLSTVVARSQIKKFSGGLIAPRYLANLDSEGKGIQNRFKIGRQTVYPVKDAINWLIERIELP